MQYTQQKVHHKEGRWPKAADQRNSWDFPGGPVVKNPLCKAEVLVPGWGTKIRNASK